MTTADRGAPARRLMQQEKHGVLSTLSLKLAGWPFGSLTPYALSAVGEPVILISEIAEHTRNLRADPRASLIIQDSNALADPQAGARLTLLGPVQPVPEAEVADVSHRYFARFPAAQEFGQTHDFTFFQLTVEHVRFIGGFGEIYWLAPSEIRRAAAHGDPLAPYAAGICEHMNQDHADALLLYAAAFAGLTAEAARMVHVDAQGFELIVDRNQSSEKIRLAFPRQVTTTDEVRQVMIEMLRQARART